MVVIPSTDGKFHDINPSNVVKVSPPAYGDSNLSAVQSLIELRSGEIIRSSLGVSEARARLTPNPYSEALGV